MHQKEEKKRHRNKYTEMTERRGKVRKNRVRRDEANAGNSDDKRSRVKIPRRKQIRKQ